MSSETLHLEVSVATSTSQTMKNNATEIEEKVKLLQTQINDFVGTHWMGNAAVQFQTEFDTWFSKALAEAGELKELTGRLDREIANWQEAASGLAG